MRRRSRRRRHRPEPSPSAATRWSAAARRPECALAERSAPWCRAVPCEFEAVWRLRQHEAEVAHELVPEGISNGDDTGQRRRQHTGSDFNAEECEGSTQCDEQGDAHDERSGQHRRSKQPARRHLVEDAFGGFRGSGVDPCGSSQQFSAERERIVGGEVGQRRLGARASCHLQPELGHAEQPAGEGEPRRPPAAGPAGPAAIGARRCRNRCARRRRRRRIG